MKTEFVATLSLLLAGCQTSRPHSAQQPPPRPPAAVAPAGLRSPETIRTYAVGAYVDPDDDSVRHEAHLIHRLERPAGWNFTTAAPELAPTPPPAVALTPLVLPAAVLTPVLPPTPAIAPAPVPAAIPVITPPGSSVAIPPAAVTRPPPEPPSLPPTQNSEPILTPNAENVIDLAAFEQSSGDDDANPFAVRPLPSVALREFSLRVGGVFSGARAGALVNDRALLIGDTTDALTLTRVEPDAAVFRLGTRLLRVPVSATPVQVRLAP